MMSVVERRSAASDTAEVSGLPTVEVLGVRITNATADEAIALLDRWMGARDGRARAVYIVNAHSLNLAFEDPGYRAVLNAADAVFGDGTGVRWGARARGVRMRENLVGTDLLPRLFRVTGGRGYRYFLLGASADTVARATAGLARDFPGICIAGQHHGYLRAGEGAAVLDRIHAAAPDMLLVAMGNPLQERWIHDQLPALRVPVSVGVGGLFDHWAGNLRRAPRWVRGLGVEWVQILLQQPAKWRRYLLGNPKFIYRLWVHGHRGRMTP